MTTAPVPEPTTLASWARSILRVMQEAGLDGPAEFAAAGLDPAVMSRSDGRYPVRAMTPLWQALHAACGPGVGLRVGRSMHWRDMQIIGLAFLSSRGMQQALQRAQQYGALLSEALAIQLVPEEGLLALDFSYTLDAPLLEERLEAVLTIVLQVAQHLIEQPLQPVRVDLCRAEPADAAPWRRVFGEHIRWGAASHRLYVEPTVLAVLAPVIDPALSDSHEQMLREWMSRRTQDVPLTRIQQVIREQLQQQRVPALDDITRQLNMSTRSLQRLLSAHGSTFSRELDGARRALALQHLEQGLAPGKVAYALGYLEPSSFYKAFRRWTGGTPGQGGRGAG